MSDQPRRVVYTLAELLALEDPGNRWLIPGVIQASSRVILYGHGNVGKSLITFDLAISIAAGTPFLGLAEPERTGPVLVFSTEGDIFSNRDRFAWICKAHGVPSDLPVYFCQDAYILDLPPDQKALYALVAQIRPALLVLDPLDSFFWGEENSATATKAIRHFLNRLIRDFGVCVFSVHHASGKPAEIGELKRPRGSTAWHGWADTIIRASSASQGKGFSKLALDVEKQRNGKVGRAAEVSPTVDPVRGLITFDDGPAAGYGAQMTRVLELLVDGPNTLAGLRALMGGRVTTVRAAVEALVKNGAVRETQVETVSKTGAVRMAYGFELATPNVAAPQEPPPTVVKLPPAAPVGEPAGGNGVASGHTISFSAEDLATAEALDPEPA